ncbi:MAG TPA: ISNCY family transposase [Ktedonosporobacter sp.]|nr:ISNCY family transposase [Ktedonosporobacter sp.]
MLVDRYPAEDVFARVPELAEQTDPVLKQLDLFLDDDDLYMMVRADLGHRHRYTLVRGRHSTPVEVILRLLLVKHLYGWSYQETLDRVADSLVLRWFTRVSFQPLPDESTLIRWAHTLRPETLHALNDRVVELATQAKVTRGRKLRLDATCARLVQRAKPLVAQAGTRVTQVKELCRSRLRTARRTAQSLHRFLRRKSETKEEEQRTLYRHLIETTEQMVTQVKRVTAVLGQSSEQPAKRLLEGVTSVLPLIERVITQARVRVLAGGKVEAKAKVLSLYEPHTRAIPRHKGGAQIEFGRQVVLDEVEGGIVTRYQVLADGESDRGQGLPALAHHQGLFGHPPQQMAGDRGIHSPTTAQQAKAAGVQVVAIPALGSVSAVRREEERSRRWKRAYRWRAGIEGRIHSLRRDYGLRKCSYHGPDGMERWVGWGILTSNLHHIAAAKAA